MDLQVSDLACARGGVPVLSGVGFALRAGEALLLRGPNGSGKTTLLRTLAGLQPPIAGTVSVAPEDIAYAGHADGVKATLTVTENLAFWASVFGADGIGGALDAFDLGLLADRQGQHLSAGQRRRLGLARLLIAGRPVWALDEPTVSLDGAAVALFVAAVSGHLSRGGTALIATHVEFPLPARSLDLTRFRAGESAAAGFDEAFL